MEKKSVKNSVLLFLLTLLLGVIQIAAVSCAWTWFVVPLGVKDIGVPHVVGLLFIVSMLKTKSYAEALKQQGMLKGKELEEVCYNISMYLFFWLCAWLVSLCM